MEEEAQGLPQPSAATETEATPLPAQDQLYSSADPQAGAAKGPDTEATAGPHDDTQASKESPATTQGGPVSMGLQSWKLKKAPSVGKCVRFQLPPETIGAAATQEGERLLFETDGQILQELTQSNLKDLLVSSSWTDITTDKLLRKKIMKEGDTEAAKPLPGQEVTVKLQGAMEDGTFVEKDPKLTFVIEEGDVIQALELCTLSMHPGEVSILITNAQYAYGHQGRDPDVPADAPLLYEVQLLCVRDAPDPKTLMPSNCIRLGKQKRERGNYYYHRDEYQSAVKSYQLALNTLTTPLRGKARDKMHKGLPDMVLNYPIATMLYPRPLNCPIINPCGTIDCSTPLTSTKLIGKKCKTPPKRSTARFAISLLVWAGLAFQTPEEKAELVEGQMKCWNNLAAVQLKLGLFEDALASSNAVLQLDPDNVKALCRKGKLLSEKGDYQSATELLKKALRLEPTTKAIHAELSNLVKKQAGPQDTPKRKPPIAKKASEHNQFLFPCIPEKTSWVLSWHLLLGAVIVAVGSVILALLLTRDQLTV
nr:PREDICTED: peptidyl-prolyl cis-trans isomerase FKBP8-like [Latimeria chalumnae]|eukprot:XP_014340350.1 PREDICTED: peptidyl-prolyl cis-trans isomerase FKBP8-like [Latimeria chalumnae]